ncbi:beta-propeller fold lactonase family protein [Psychromarinibacter sp. C21-152]|uniref:Beta-propeller fold lactonase family protein n=1 Tax=Psychromarinibacter sediminicola TaxID=3033385 RepID=A0AAE3NX04_9RHOB|nr:beta-propeller fold lactonase family protein [Psychromarinibacter sediminicola]MDF0603846.1 beta-propeller fold lactonase family protein [Psychromarinibacter sediminicola]
MPGTGAAPAEADQILAICLPGEAAVALCDFNSATGTLAMTQKQRLPGVEDDCRGVPMAANADGTRLYVAWRGADTRLFSFALDGRARRLDLLGEASLPASMCYATLAARGRRLLTSSFTGSTIAMSPVDSDGRVGEPLMVREAMHVHCLIEAPNGLVYATSLRGDFIQSYAFDESCADLTPVARCDMPSGSGPRHLVFTADGRTAFLLSEYAGSLTRLDVDPRTGALAPVQTVDLLPEGEKAWAAELRLSPDERLLYASERNTSRLFGFRLDAERRMLPAGAEAAPRCPRAFGFDRTGAYLVALGEESGEARLYRVAPDGRIAPGVELPVGTAPSWVVAAAV